jgi:hypothetical protein
MKPRNTATPLVATVAGLLALGYFALLPLAQAVNPPPDGGYPNGTTAEGTNALFSLTGGIYNTAVGSNALSVDTTGGYNTAIGTAALEANNADENTATGVAALHLSTSGCCNTANGAFALFQNSGGHHNTALGDRALQENTAASFNTAAGAAALGANTSGNHNAAFGSSAMIANLSGSLNTAVGADALASEQSGSNNVAVGDQALHHQNGVSNNTAVGFSALFNNTSGTENTAVGWNALASNATTARNTAVGYNALGANQKDFCTAVGAQALEHSNNSWNTAVGYGALDQNTTGDHNSAFGMGALSNSTIGAHNIAVGADAGNAQTSLGGHSNIYIGDAGSNGESNVIAIGRTPTTGTSYTKCYIGGIVGNGPFGSAVSINPATGQLGVNVSSERFKKDIDPMGKTSEALFSLKPVTFHYKNDKTNTQQWGLIAEEVAKVNPALIGVDKDGKPYCVRYDQVNAMLLNEFLRAHRRMEEQEATIAKQQKQIAALAGGLQKVSAQLELTKSAPQTVLNNQ